MGGSVSAGKDNDDFIDNLIEANYIRTPSVEKVFRTVDRAFYFLPECRYSAYRDSAWKHDNLHLSAPCIYSEVLEHLKLEAGRSFLNIGSGTGYLSTMAGLILGPYGVNHGIEIQPDVVDYAYDKLEQFKKTCNGLDMFEFCEPYFVVGNGFDLSHERKYDRIYCGAACPQTHHEHIKKHLKINGILIVPCDEDLLKIVRTSETDWEVTSVLSVSFATLQSPDKLSRTIAIPDPQPLQLQELCRSKIRCLFRSAIEKENPSLTEKRKRRRVSNRGIRRREVNGLLRDRFELGSVLFHDFMRNLRRESVNEQNYAETSSDTEGQVVIANDSESGLSESEYEHEHEHESNSNSNVVNESSASRESSDIGNALVSRFIRNDVDVGMFVSSDEDDGEDDPESEIDLEEISAEVLRCHSRRRLSTMNGYSFEGVIGSGDVDESSQSISESHQNVRKKVDEEGDKQPKKLLKREKLDSGISEESDNQPKKLLKREKLDSGISEESDDGKVSRSYESSFSESTFGEPMELESDDSESNRSLVEIKDDNEVNGRQPSEESLARKYRLLMEEKIQCLPLPQRIKIYLNHDREFQVEKH